MFREIMQTLAGDAQADRIVPPSGFTARLTAFTAAAMAFLAVFALALSLATHRLAERWSTSLAQSSTIRISAPLDQREAQTRAVLALLQTTPGVASSRALDPAEQRALLEPWFGPDLPVETLPIPQLVEVVETTEGYDAQGLRLRLAAEAPGAILDDHARWRRPLVRAAGRLHVLGLGALALILCAMAAMITLAAMSALAANRDVMRVLRLIGARDTFIARAFVRRFTIRAAGGALFGTLAGMLAIWALPSVEQAGGFLTGLGFTGAGWLAPLLVPPVAGLTAFWATRLAALRALRSIS
ncbi:cell division transport system permease protein [Palleronia marisminoris]|uniref:Cell division ABC transporter subunit FtsX n=1 Tax=Palleronia marisminoris TaxID=315423 RepID=A0A1Y5T5V3_9RHOB|nr:FtsX-like permease family protein [Palleronia marisminoris]SFH12925.1 cell division transport system permease protein [Palleronia marisminoris]SLN53196.1 cell division ABC transporter subunit FtsX [Palleronia marisminoris]